MATLSQIEAYVGLAYDPCNFDCADLAVLVQQQLFRKVVTLPGQRQRRQAQVATIERYRDELAVAVDRDQIQDGDVVLIKGKTMHIGTLFFLSGSWRVLHNSQSIGHCVLHRLTDVPMLGMFIEGFYRWK